MIDLKEVITKYPECLESPERFRSYMLDLYPDNANQARIKVLADVMKSGIVAEIKNGKTDNLALQNYRNNMERQFGYSARLVTESILQWVRAFEKEAPAETAEPTAATPPAAEAGKIHVHKFKDTVVPGNCRERGYTLHQCGCGYSYKDSFTPLGSHAFEVVDLVEPTCTEPGRKDFLCAVCREYKSEDLPALGHEGDWQTQIFATCTAAGKKIRQCARCGKTEEKAIQATGHRWSKWAKSAAGKWERFCENCGEENTTYNNPDNFVIENNILKQYRGSDKSVEIPNGVTSIGVGAFDECEGLRSIIIPDSVTEIGEAAFCGRSILTSVTIGNSIISIGRGAFSGCLSLTSIIIPDSVTKIGEYAFSGCSSLASITIPDSVTEIGDGAFRDCKSLTSVTLPDSVTSIGKEVFRACESLTSIIIPDGVTSIGKEAFYFCSRLESINIPNSVTEIGEVAFCGTSLKNIIIPISVTKIGRGAFDDRVEKITVATGNRVYHSAGNCLIETASKTLIFGCENSVIPDDGSVTTIGDYAFGGCDGIKNIIIPNGVTTIGDYAFGGCDGIKNIIIPNGVTSIGENAFYACMCLESITVPDSVTSIGFHGIPDPRYGLFSSCTIIVISSNSYAAWYCKKYGITFKTQREIEEQKAEERRKEDKKRRQAEEAKRQAEERRKAEEARRQAEERRKAEEQRRYQFRQANLCQHCGGDFKGLFKKTCSQCGKPKDY